MTAARREEANGRATAPRVTRLLLWLLGVPGLVVGLWAGFAPRSFYDDFPGGGRHWVTGDGPFNEHLVRDVGTLNLALAVATLAASLWLGRRLVQTVAAAAVVNGVPHLVYHVRHHEALASADASSALVSLTAALVLAVVVLALQARPAQGDRPAVR